MIVNFKCKKTAELFNNGRSRHFKAFERQALRKLFMLNHAEIIEDLLIPPSNHLEALQGTRKGQHSIRINRQWRVCFIFKDGHVHNVEIVDYH